METVLLLRSYGDFVISLYHQPTNRCPKRLIASKHLEPLHQALFPYLSPAHQSVEFIDIGIKHQILSGFTNRYFFTKENMVELSHLRKQMIGLDNLYLEQKRRSWLIQLVCKRKLPAVYTHDTEHGNIYHSWAVFYQNGMPVITEKKEIKSVLIFPDSRLKKKEIKENVLQQMERQIADQNIYVKRAYFKKSSAGLCYENFDELVNLIAGADYIISSDSLPAHIAQLLQKPHAIIYANKINHEFTTPYSRANQTAFTFSSVNEMKF